VTAPIAARVEDLQRAHEGFSSEAGLKALGTCRPDRRSLAGQQRPSWHPTHRRPGTDFLRQFGWNVPHPPPLR
jgi:hypothetical protein